MHMLQWLLLSVCVFCCTYGKDLLTDDEEDMSYYLGKLYEEPKEGDLDPHDMLNYRGHKASPKIDTRPVPSFTLDDGMSDKGSCNFEKLNLDEKIEKLQLCEQKLEILQRDGDRDKVKLRNLEKKLSREGSVDMKAYYLRFVHHFWSVLGLEEVQSTLRVDEVRIKRLFVQISQEDLTSLQNFMQYEDNIQQVDEFFQRGFEIDDSEEEVFEFNLRPWVDWMLSLVEVGKKVEVWLYMLCLGFLTLGIWAVYLFIRDIQQELRWMRVIMMMIVVLFFICCLWHWRHMQKVAESRRHAQMMKRGFNNMPEECKPGYQGTTYSMWEWIKVRAFGAPDICEKYFEELMIDPTEEITPAMVIAETLAKFFLQPLQHLGSESAKFITNFYSNVPVVYHIPATIFFILLLIILLFAFCGYGIDFPLWMGGIRPIYRPEAADTTEVDRITKEAVAQLKNDREKFLSESRMMLTDIAQAAAVTQAQADIRPLLMMSSNILEAKLEALISNQFSNKFPDVLRNDGSSNNGHSLQQNITPPNESGEVFTVTSTPLREHNKPVKSSSTSFNNEDVRDGKDDDNAMKDAGSNTSSVVAVPDVVHYRFMGGHRKHEFPPKKSSLSTSTVKDDSLTSSQSSIAGSSEPMQSISAEPNSSMVLRRRNTNKTGDSGASSPSPDHSINYSLSRSNIELQSGDESVSEDFYDRVKSILEDSANSSMNLDSSIDSEFNRSAARGLNVPHKDEEVELSTSGVKFMSKIKKVMTP